MKRNHGRFLEVGARLRAARRAAGLMQQQVAEAIGVQRRAVYTWESGQRLPAEHLPALAALYGVTTSYLLHGVEPSSIELRELRVIADALTVEVSALRRDVDVVMRRLVALAELTGEALADLRVALERLLEERP